MLVLASQPPGPHPAPGFVERRNIDVKFNLMSLGDHITDPVTGDRPTAQQRHRAFVDMAVRSEAAGFNGVNVGEHHCLEYIYSAPPVLLAAIAERTTTLRLGTAVT